jgi:hypothetical protein
VTIPTTADILALDSSRTVRAATMVRIEAPIRYIHEILLTTGQRSKTSTCRAASILFQQRLVQNGCEGDYFLKTELCLFHVVKQLVKSSAHKTR